MPTAVLHRCEKAWAAKSAGGGEREKNGATPGPRFPPPLPAAAARFGSQVRKESRGGSLQSSALDRWTGQRPKLDVSNRMKTLLARANGASDHDGQGRDDGHHGRDEDQPIGSQLHLGGLTLQPALSSGTPLKPELQAIADLMGGTVDGNMLTPAFVSPPASPVAAGL